MSIEHLIKRLREIVLADPEAANAPIVVLAYDAKSEHFVGRPLTRVWYRKLGKEIIIAGDGKESWGRG